MASPMEAADAAIGDVERLRAVIKKGNSPQVRTSDEQLLAKSTALAWFEKHREPIVERLGVDPVVDLDGDYRNILESSAKHASRSKYIGLLTNIRKQLVRVRTDAVGVRGEAAPVKHTPDASPDFSPLIGDQAMRTILENRWNECVTCLNANAPLAATVMMGSLLEGLLLARINSESDKSPIFKAKAAPKGKDGAPKKLAEWMLNDFIQVLGELNWISVSAWSAGGVLRDYRNYIHPQKQLSHGIHLTSGDAILFWEISKNIVRQVIGSKT